MQGEGENSAVDFLGSSAIWNVTTRPSYKHVTVDSGRAEGEAKVPAVTYTILKHLPWEEYNTPSPSLCTKNMCQSIHLSV